jgi:hypothetical protein
MLSGPHAVLLLTAAGLCGLLGGIILTAVVAGVRCGA